MKKEEKRLRRRRDSIEWLYHLFHSSKRIANKSQKQQTFNSNLLLACDGFWLLPACLLLLLAWLSLACVCLGSSNEEKSRRLIVIMSPCLSFYLSVYIYDCTVSLYTWGVPVGVSLLSFFFLFFFSFSAGWLYPRTNEHRARTHREKYTTRPNPAGLANLVASRAALGMMVLFSAPVSPWAPKGNG